MTITEYLIAQDFPSGAKRIAIATGLAIEDAYAQLVAMESAGLARVVVDCEGFGHGSPVATPPRYWEATEALIDLLTETETETA